jgi:hypothetical protein
MRWQSFSWPSGHGSLVRSAEKDPGTCLHWHFSDLGPIGPEFSMHKSVTFFYEFHSSFSDVASFLAFYNERLGHNEPFPPGQNTGTCLHCLFNLPLGQGPKFTTHKSGTFF